MYKLALFDLDGTILNGRTIFYIAEKKGFKKELLEIFNMQIEPFEKSLHIAKLLKGINKNEIIQIFSEIPLRPNALDLIKFLKNNRIILALATDGYDIVADNLGSRLGFDYTFANNLIINDDIVTGELVLNNKNYRKDEISNNIYSICKECILEKICEENDVSIKDTIAIGDGIVDIGMIKKAGLGIAINASDEVNRYADFVTNNHQSIIEYIKKG
jgi:phosphoserine phosphatase